MTALLEIDGLKKRYAGFEVLRGVGLKLERGDVKIIIGPSGSGKSTLLRCAALLEPFNEGVVRIQGEDSSWISSDSGVEARGAFHSLLVRQRAKLGVVFQNFNLFPHLTALENVSLGPTVVHRLPTSEATELAEHHLNDVGLSARSHAYPYELSGGQQQRVAIARALAMQPALLLLDEPTAALDMELTIEVLNTLHKLADRGVTMLGVTHELSFARAVANEVLVMDDGWVIESGTPAHIFENATVERTRRFINKIQD